MFFIYHKAISYIGKAINNQKHRDMIHYLYMRIKTSSLINEEGRRFFLIKNIDYLSEELGHCKFHCQSALKYLTDNGFISKDKVQCHDGAVRIRVYMTPKLKEIMSEATEIFSRNSDKKEDFYLENKPVVRNFRKTETDRKSSNYKDFKKSNNSINKVNYKNNSYVKFKFSHDLEQQCEASENHIRKISEEKNIDPAKLFNTCVELEEMGTYGNTERLIADAIRLCQDKLPLCDARTSHKKAFFRCEQERYKTMTTKQKVATVKHLRYLSKKVPINIEEVYKWITYQVTNPEHHMKDRDFAHTSYIIGKLICTKGSRNYAKPYGLH